MVPSISAKGNCMKGLAEAPQSRCEGVSSCTLQAKTVGGKQAKVIIRKSRRSASLLDK